MNRCLLAVTSLPSGTNPLVTQSYTENHRDAQRFSLRSSFPLCNSVLQKAVTMFLPIVISLLLCGTSLAQSAYPPINPDNITIARDSFGVPHIFAKTDAEVAYGIAWAGAEDAFFETQNLIYVAKGYMARKDGVGGAKVDFFVHAIGARDFVEKHYDTDISEETKRYMDGYCQGINAYAKAHPDEVTPTL